MTKISESDRWLGKSLGICGMGMGYMLLLDGNLMGGWILYLGGAFLFVYALGGYTLIDLK